MGSQSFLPGGMIQLAATAATARRGVRAVGRRRSTRTKKIRKRARKAAARGRGRTAGKRKPKPGTKAWMTYIRGMRGKKKRK